MEHQAQTLAFGFARTKNKQLQETVAWVTPIASVSMPGATASRAPAASPLAMVAGSHS
jgi:hypothetical protein